MRRASEDHQGVAGGDAVRGVRAEVGTPVNDPAHDPASPRPSCAGSRTPSAAGPASAATCDTGPSHHTPRSTLTVACLCGVCCPSSTRKDTNHYPARAAQCGLTDLTAEGDPTSGIGPIPGWGAFPGPRAAQPLLHRDEVPGREPERWGPSWLCAPPDGDGAVLPARPVQIPEGLPAARATARHSTTGARAWLQRGLRPAERKFIHTRAPAVLPALVEGSVPHGVPHGAAISPNSA